MQYLICNHRDLPSHLADGIFKDRRRQFVERLQWNLCITPTGRELDEYDDENSYYLVIHEKGRHIGSCRVRPTGCSTMITDHFAESFPHAASFLIMQNERMFELTRFCRSPDISAKESKEMMRNIGILIDQFRDQKKLTGFVAVVFPKVARLMDKIGMRYVLLAQSVIQNEKVYMICITHAEPLAKHIPTVQFDNTDEFNVIPIAQNPAFCGQKLELSGLSQHGCLP